MLRRRRADAIWCALNRWKMSGNCIMAFKKYYQRVRQVQTFWRQARKRLHRIRDECSVKWVFN